jgi:hypothetical protein
VNNGTRLHDVVHTNNCGDGEHGLGTETAHFSDANDPGIHEDPQGGRNSHVIVTDYILTMTFAFN